ncbi:hypothetical protein ACFRJ9_01750 [Paenarthrobacter sp. NPDC056912]|uniref:hypothetical protein n=1 Tax=Paenarthrobacter sp. NPDC056912 TaxID=3345965 RepID=UPI00366E9F85
MEGGTLGVPDRIPIPAAPPVQCRRDRRCCPLKTTSCFDNLAAEEMSELVSSYKLLGEAFEDRDDDGMFGLGFHMEDPLTLIKYKAERAAQARRELVAAIKLARYKGHDWKEIGPTLWGRP